MCLYKEKGRAVHSVTALWLTKTEQFIQERGKDTHQSDLAPAVLTMFFSVFFPCVVQTSQILNRILSFHCFPCS